MHSYHLAGIIPVAKQPYDFKLPWDDCLMPIAHNYLAVERAVAECAYVGCETIWIVCHKDMQPLIKKRIGEKTTDPLRLNSRTKYLSRVKRAIQIYYVPIHPNDRDKRDCLSWSVLYGALSAFLVSAKLSKWVTPDKYFVSFPWGIYSSWNMREHRKAISSDRNFCTSYNGKTIKDGLMLPFTFGSDDWKKARDNFKELAKEQYFKRKERGKIKYDFSLDKIFKSYIIDNTCELEKFSQIDSWEAYQNYMRTELSLEMKRPGFLRPAKWNEITHYKEEDDEPGEEI